MKASRAGAGAGRGAVSLAAMTKGTIIARIERLPHNSMHVQARLLVGLATFFDGFNVIVIATTLPPLIAKWALSPAQIGILISSGSIGQLLGTLVFPYLAERYGRVRSIVWSSGLIGFTSIACGFAPTFTAFMLLRTVQGIGLGGELPVAATYINEITRAHGRGRFVLFYEIVFPVGLLIANAIGAWLVPRFGWQIMYFIGGLPVILFFMLRSTVPESPRWLCEKGRLAEAGAALRAFEERAKAPLAPIQDPHAYDQLTEKRPKRRVRDLLGTAYLGRTMAVWAAWITAGFIQYGLTIWLPTIYKTVYHAPLQLALVLAVAPSVLAVIGSAVAALIVDRVGRKPVINISFLLCALSLALAAILHAQSLYVVATLCSLAFGFMGCGFITAYVYTPELYPTSIRAIGCGLGGTWLKIAAIFAPGIVAGTIATGNLASAFYTLAAVPFVAAVAIHFLGAETKEKILEQLEV